MARRCKAHRTLRSSRHDEISAENRMSTSQAVRFVATPGSDHRADLAKLRSPDGAEEQTTPSSGKSSRSTPRRAPAFSN